MLTWYAAESSDIPQHTTFSFPLISKTFYAHTFRMSAKFAKACNAVKISGTSQHLLQHWVKLILVVVVRPSGNGVGTINKVTLCQLLSVPRWVTFRGVPPQHATTNSGELSYLPLQEEKCVLAKRHCFDWQGNRKSGNTDSVIYPIIDSMWCKAPFTCLNLSFALAILAYTIHVLWMHLYNECRIKFKPFWTPNWNYNSCHLGWC